MINELYIKKSVSSKSITYFENQHFFFSLNLSIMTTTDQIRNGIIENLLTISNKDYLTALFQLVKNSSVDTDTIKLTEEQVVMLHLSEKDIKDGKLISQAQLDKSDLKWLKEL
jgi:hypothetical protein